MPQRSSHLLAEQRKRKILSLIEETGQVTVRELATRFGVSSVTARADLDTLCAEGLVLRSHGGAVRKLDEDVSSAKDSTRSETRPAHPAVDKGFGHATIGTNSKALVGHRESGSDALSESKMPFLTYILGNRDTINEFQAKVLLGAEALCASLGWRLQFVSFPSDLSAPSLNVSLPEVLNRAGKTSGLILTGTHSANILSALQERKIPFSVVGNNIVGDWNPEKYDCVFTDDVRGASEITRYLIAQGHRNIWYIGNQRFPWFARCARGYLQTIEEAGLEPHFSEISAEDRELGYLAVKSLFAAGARPSAIFAGTDQAASGAYEALQELGLRIPDDVSVAGFNDTIGDVLRPGLTTVREFPRELGSHLVEFTIRRIVEPSLPPQQLLMPTELVRRESVRYLARATAKSSAAPLEEYAQR